MDLSKLQDIKKSLEDLKAQLAKGDMTISPSGPQGDMAGVAGQAGKGESLERADNPMQPVAEKPAETPDSKEGEKKPEDKEEKPADKKDEKPSEHKEPDGDEGKGGEGDKDGDEYKKADEQNYNLFKKYMDRYVTEELGSIEEGADVNKTETPTDDTLAKSLAETHVIVSDLTKSVSEMFGKLSSENANMKQTITNMSTQFEALASRPSGPRKAVTNIDYIRKSADENLGGGEQLDKAKVDAVLEKGVKDRAIRSQDHIRYLTEGFMTPAVKNYLKENGIK